ncbi:MAG: aromatic amino acid ammonia-lyase [Patescibacteria group bacterium]
MSKIVQSFQALKANQSSVVLTGSKLTVSQILAVARNDTPIEFTQNKKITQKIAKTHEKMLEQISNGVPIYGCNTGYGERASVVVNSGSKKERLASARAISEGIVHVDVSVGPRFEKDVVRAAMLIRINMLMPGLSAVKLGDLDIYRKILNAQITPVVNQYGGIGASGDLAHNGRVLSVARQLPGAKVINESGKEVDAATALQAAEISKLILDPKAGLGFVNGDNFSTAVAVLLATDTQQALLLSLVLSAMTIEVLGGTNRSFHSLLSTYRSHQGQVEAAEILRSLLDGSSLAKQEMTGHQPRKPGEKVQDAYSLRCLPQFQAINIEAVEKAMDVIGVNANSVSDNPLWVTDQDAADNEDAWQWVSGGNFLAMHMAESLDSLRKVMTRITKLSDRHLFRLVSPIHNNGLPANLSDSQAITQSSFKGVQIQSGMFDVYSSLLSQPVNTMFGSHEENNQDITSHALTSGILGLENIRITRYALAQQMLALFQAVELKKAGHLLSPKTTLLYDFLKEEVEYVSKERPLHHDIERLYQSISVGKIDSILHKIFSD